MEPKQNTKLLSDIYESNSLDIFRYVQFKLEDKAKTEDVTSEAFLRLFESKNINLAEMTNEEIRLYLFGITRNIIFDEYRMKKTKLETITDEEIADEFSEDQYEKIERELDAKEVNGAFKTLSNGDQEVIVLKVWEELTFESIAELLQEKLSTVKLRYYRAIEKLRADLQPAKDGKVMYSVSAPMVLLGLKSLLTLPKYTPTSEAIASIGAELFTKLGINTMNTATIAAGTTKAAGVSGLLATGAGKAMLGAAATVVLVAGGAGIIAVTNNQNKTPSVTSYPTVTPTASVEVTPTPDVTANCKAEERVSVSSKVTNTNFNNISSVQNVAQGASPKANGLYFGFFESKPAMYLHFVNQNGTFPVVYYTDKSQTLQNSSVFNDMTEKKLIFLGKQPSDEIQLQGFDYNADQDKLDVVINSNSEGNTGYTDYSNAYRVDFGTKQIKLFMQKKIFDQALFGQNGSLGIEKAIGEEYIIMYVTECYACGSPNRTYFAYNLETDTYVKLAANVGAFKYNAACESVSYRKLVKVGEYPNCPADDCGIYEPNGKKSEVKLPGIASSPAESKNFKKVITNAYGNKTEIAGKVASNVSIVVDGGELNITGDGFKIRAFDPGESHPTSYTEVFAISGAIINGLHRGKDLNGNIRYTNSVKTSEAECQANQLNPGPAPCGDDGIFSQQAIAHFICTGNTSMCDKVMRTVTIKKV